MPDDRTEIAADRHARAEQLWKAGQHGDALDLLEQAIAVDPDVPNAHNLAGWLLHTVLAGLPDARARAIAHFDEARRRFPDDPVPLCNLADALLGAGDAERAIALMTEATTASAYPLPSRAHNWLGWYHLTRSGDQAAALRHLEIAAGRSGWWGPAQQNHGRALEASGDLAAARGAYLRALRCSDAPDLPLVLSRLGAIAREQGQPRRALSWFRRALHLERAAGGGRAGEIAGACAALEEALRGHGAYFPHAADELPWIEDDQAARRLADGVDPRAKVGPLAGFAAHAEAARFALGRHPTAAAAAAVVTRLAEAARTQTLPPEHAGEPTTLDPAGLPAGAAEAVRPLLHPWSRLHRLLYARLLERDEPQLDGPAARIGALLTAGRHDDALAALRALLDFTDTDAVLACWGLAETAADDARLDGRPAHAAGYYAYALEVARYWASCSTSGGEGMARMVDVHRLERRLAGDPAG